MRQHIKNQRHHFVNKGPSSQGYSFPSGHVWMWELDYKESWAQKNWCFWTMVLEKALESPLDYKEIQPIHPKGDQSWVFIGRTDAEAETPILWPPDAKSWLIWKDPDVGKDWGQEEQGVTEDKMVRWPHWLNRHVFRWTLGVGDGQGGLAWYSSWGHKESDRTERLNWTELNLMNWFWKFFKSKCLRGLSRWLSVTYRILPLSMWEMKELWVRSLGQEDPLEKEITIHSSILVWEIPWTEKPSRLPSMRSQRIRHDLVTKHHHHHPGISQGARKKKVLSYCWWKWQQAQMIWWVRWQFASKSSQIRKLFKIQFPPSRLYPRETVKTRHKP